MVRGQLHGMHSGGGKNGLIPAVVQLMSAC